MSVTLAPTQRQPIRDYAVRAVIVRPGKVRDIRSLAGFLARLGKRKPESSAVALLARFHPESDDPAEWDFLI